MKADEYTPFIWHCVYCGEPIVSYLENHRIRFQCPRCGSVMIRTLKRNYDWANIYPPKGCSNIPVPDYVPDEDEEELAL